MKERLGHQVIKQEWGIGVRTSGLVVFRCLRFAHCLAINLFNFKENHTKSTQFMGIMPMMSFHSFLVFQKDLLKLH